MPAVCFKTAEVFIGNRNASDKDTVILFRGTEGLGIGLARNAVLVVEGIFGAGL